MAVSMIILVILSGISCFNIDTDNVIHFKGKEGIHFGYSAELFNSGDGQKWVIVGAPKANFTTHPNITRPGNIYKCKLDFKQRTQSACEPLNLKNSDSAKFPETPGYEEDDQLLGASMAVIDDQIVTCAPLWKNMIPIRSSNISYPIGRCSNIAKTVDTFTSNQFKKDMFKEYSPESEFTYEFAVIGLSISNKKLIGTQFDTLIGTPGFYENKGGFFEYNPLSTTNQFFISFTHKALNADQQKSIEMGTLLGYSISTGRLADNDPDCPAVVVLGAPHFGTTNGIVGSVLVVCAESGVFGKQMTIKKQFFGTKSGCGYGASLLFDDVNGDGMDDLLVGAPLQDNKPVFDVGSVYIYYGDDNPSEPLKESTNQQLRGSNQQFSRFGSAMQCIGDINKDGFKDIVVAAPYEDNLKGAIYVYHGGRDSLTMTQRINAKNIGIDLYSFGWYISAANDIDNNQYPDFLVGSYMSNTVSLLRTRPIIKLSSTFTIDPLVIPLNSSGLQCQDSQFRPCVSIQLCFNYSGINVPNSIMVAYNVSSDTLRTNAIPSRASRVQIFTEGDQQGGENIEKQIIVNKNGSTCVPFMRAVVQAVSREFFASLNEELVLETTYGLSNEPIPGDVQPILNNVPSKNKASATFSTGCNGPCHPDLNLDVSLDPTVLFLRNTSDIVIRCTLTNTGEMSHATQITIRASIKAEYVGFLQPQSLATALVSCQGSTDRNNQSFVQCDLKSTLFQQQKAIFEVRFLVLRSNLVRVRQSLDTFEQNIVFTTKAESTSPDTDESDNTRILTAKVKLQSKVELSGVSLPDQLKVSDKGDKTLSFVHKYYVLNHGPSPLNNGTLFICIPVKDSLGTMMMSKDDLMVNVNSPNLRWRLIQFAGETFYSFSSQQGERSSTSTSAMLSTSTLPTRSSVVPNRKRRETADQLVQDQKANEIAKKNFKEISCSSIEQDRQAIIQIDIGLLEQDQTESFDVTMNISEKTLSFEKVSGILYKSTGEVERRNDNRYETFGTNATYDISSEIFPKEVSIEAEKINIWIIIGGCIGGLVLLIVLGVILWKCGFFKRKKKDDIQKWKRQSGYYAKRQSARAGSTKSSHVKNVDNFQ